MPSLIPKNEYWSSHLQEIYLGDLPIWRFRLAEKYLPETDAIVIYVIVRAPKPSLPLIGGYKFERGYYDHAFIIRYCDVVDVGERIILHFLKRRIKECCEKVRAQIVSDLQNTPKHVVEELKKLFPNGASAAHIKCQ